MPIRWFAFTRSDGPHEIVQTLDTVDCAKFKLASLHNYDISLLWAEPLLNQFCFNSLIVWSARPIIISAIVNGTVCLLSDACTWRSLYIFFHLPAAFCISPAAKVFFIEFNWKLISAMFHLWPQKTASDSRRNQMHDEKPNEWLQRLQTQRSEISTTTTTTTWQKLIKLVVREHWTHSFLPLTAERRQWPMAMEMDANYLLFILFQRVKSPCIRIANRIPRLIRSNDTWTITLAI